MAADIGYDVLEQILIGLDAEDLIQFKRVCKSWYSLITSPPFVKAHLKYSNNTDRDKNPKLGHRRIIGLCALNIYLWLCDNLILVVGSCNGLVCVSPVDAQFVVTNPATRQHKKLQIPPFKLANGMMIRHVVCWGFGYDSSTDDYKVVVGFRVSVEIKKTLFYVLALKSNVWKVISQVNYRCRRNGVDGILYGGALHWFMYDENKRVLISFDLSTDEFKEIHQPTYKEYVCHDGHRHRHKCVDDPECDEYALGVLEDYLCIYTWILPLSHKIWILKNNKWEPYYFICDTYDVVHHVEVSEKNVYTYNDGARVRNNGTHLSASIFVKSLVSPHPRCIPHISNNDNGYERQYRNSMQVQEAKETVESGVKGNIKKKKRSMRRKWPFKHMMIRKVSMMKKRSSCKHKTPPI